MIPVLRFLLPLCLCAVAFADEPALTAPPLSGKLGEPISLFNGKDFTGWAWFQRPPKPDSNTTAAKLEDVFSVKDGIIHSKGKPTGYLRTERAFTNFVFTVEQRHVKEGNGGLLVGIGPQDKVWPGIEIQTMTGHAGELWNHNQLELTAPPARIDPSRPANRHILRAAPDSQKPVGGWDTMEVIVDSGNLVFKVNGVVQNVVTKTESLAGRVGIQSEGAEMEFRKIQITPIEPAK